MKQTRIIRKPWVSQEPQPILFPEIRRSFVQQSSSIVVLATAATLSGTWTCSACGTASSDPYAVFCGWCGKKLVSSC